MGVTCTLSLFCLLASLRRFQADFKTLVPDPKCTIPLCIQMLYEDVVIVIGLFVHVITCHHNASRRPGNMGH